MASLDQLTAEYTLAPSNERRSLLLSIGRSAKGPLSLGKFGGSPADAVVHVVDMDGEVNVGSREDGLVLAARSLQMELLPAMPVQDEQGKFAGFAVMFDVGGELQTLAQAETEDAATQDALSKLEQVVGSMVLTLDDWVSGQMQAGFVAEKAEPKKRKAPAIGHVCEVTYVGRWVAAGVYRWEAETPWAPSDMKLAEAIAELQRGQSLLRIQDKRRATPRYRLRLVEIDGNRYAEHHDLVTAARAGVMLDGVRPWPHENANSYVVLRNFMRYMRERGWRAPWKDEAETGALKLHDRCWMRAKPIPML